MFSFRTGDVLVNSIHYKMDENHSREFVNCLVGLHAAHQKNAERPLQVYWNLRSNLWWKDLAPCYFGAHRVKVSLWNYPNDVALLDRETEQSPTVQGIRSLDLRELPAHIVNDERNLAANNQNSGFYFNVDGASVEYRPADFGAEQLADLRKGSPESSDTSSAYCSESNFTGSNATNGLANDRDFARNEPSSGKKVSFIEPSSGPNPLPNGYLFDQQHDHGFFSSHYNAVRYKPPGKLKISEGMQAGLFQDV